MFGWFGKRSLEGTPIDAGLWHRATAPYLFARGLPAADLERLRRLAGRFLARKHFSGTHGLEVTGLMHVQVAAQASILVLELGLEWYDGWSEIIVYPGQFAPEREIVDEAGVVHLVNDPMAGEAWLGGPVILSYEDVAMTSDEAARVAGYNVVIHEFAHKLDMLSGEPNGCPPLHAGMALAKWRGAFSEAYADFCRRVDRADRLARRDGGRALDELPIDPYASENPGEFFAVVSEAFFETPEWLEPAYPAVYSQLRQFYRQDPLARLGAERA
jgi:Mlc titration factor MtfA (ptsG expression regulator)